MESTVVGGTLFLDGEWESICRLFTVDQETDFASSSFLTHHHHHQDDSNNGDGSLPLLTSQYNVSTTDPSNSKFDNVLEPVGNHLTPPSSNDLSQVSSISADTTTATTPFDLGCHFQTDQFSCLQPFMDFLSIETNKDDDDGSLFFTFPPDCDSISEQQLGTPMVDAGSSNHRLMMHNADELVKPQQATLTPKKRARASKDSEKGKRKISEKKRKESILTTTDEGEPGKTDSNNNGQSSSCTDKVIISHNESNAASLEDNDGSETSVTLNGKKIRANRGAATDPQSLYARKRRERINERLRILQNLVPNGTKVDISTMLEEAVHYVKFLQLQIKLLSSDDMWMYSPLAYNGYDINLCSSFSPYVMKS